MDTKVILLSAVQILLLILAGILPSILTVSLVVLTSTLFMFYLVLYVLKSDKSYDSDYMDLPLDS